jgi:hypothetical protein
VPKTLGQRVLERASKELGSEGELAARLRISHTRLSAYLAGTLPTPDAVLLRAVDVVLDEPKRPISPAARPPQESESEEGLS